MYTMKNKKLLVGTASLVLAAAAFTLFPGQDDYSASYTSRTSPTNRVNSAADMAEYMALLKANVKTGKVEASDFIKAQQEVEEFSQKKGGGPGLTWTELGPDNSGGRCRAIKVDPSSFNVVWAGSVTGGLFKTTSGGNLWERVESFHENLAVNMIEIAGNGYIYVGTGPSHDGPSANEGSGAYGNGVYVSTDNGVTWERIDAMTPGPVSSDSPGGGDWSEVNEIWADPNNPNRVWVGGNAGLFTYETAGNATAGTLTPVAKSTGSTNWNQIDDMAVSVSGKNIIVIEGTKTYVSNDFGVTLTQVSGNGAGQIPSGGVGRTEVAISPQDEDWIYAASAGTNSFMKGVYHSIDGGNTWDEINPGGAFQADPYASADGSRAQGNYDNCITVNPNDKTQIIVGGIRLFDWKQATTNPSFGQWEQIAFQGSQGLGSVHADIHEFEWDPNGTLYIGTDGGVYISQDVNSLFHYSANRGFNCAQFYGISHNAYGHTFGGTQDNGMFLLSRQGNTFMEAIFSSSGIGDGFTTEMSHYYPDVMFGTSQYGWLDRSNDGGVSFNTFYAGPIASPTLGVPGESLGPFSTQIAMWETQNDPNSPDSIFYIFNTDNVTDSAGYVYQPGDTVFYSSATQQTLLWHVLTSSYTVADATDTLDILNTDTISLVDPIQSLFAIGFNSSQGVWVTRSAMRFSANPEWFQIMDASTGGNPNFGGSSVKTLEWSKDGNHLYVGTYGGSLWRVSGFDSAYTFDHMDIAGADIKLDYARIKPSGNGVLSGIAVDPNDEDHVIVTTGGFGGSHVWESNNATTAAHNTNAFVTQIQGDMPNIPAYSVIIDVADPTGNTIVVGTEYGVYATDDGGSSWFDQNATMDRVPVHDMTQQWRPWGDGPTTNAGVIYLGTHGRGMFMSETLVTADDVDGGDLGNKFETNLNVYPNPVRDISTVEFELENPSDVIINVYDINGRTIQTMSLQGLNAGTNQVQINASNWDAGNYFVRLESATQMEVAKIVVSK